MNIFATDVFPYIEGVMLKEKRATFHIKHVEVTEMDYGGGGDWRTEVKVKERPKSAILNKTQTRKLADVYGPETNDWLHKPIVLYGEFGKWFGKEQWGLRVDKEQTERAYSKWQAEKRAREHKREQEGYAENAAAAANSDLFDDAAMLTADEEE